MGMVLLKLDSSQVYQMERACESHSYLEIIL